MLLPPYLVHGVPQVHGDMKFIERNLGLPVGERLGDGLDVGLVHVHRYHLDAFALFLRKAAQEALERLLAAPVSHMQHPLVRPARVVDDRHVLVPLLERRLVDRQRLRQLDGPSGKPAPLHDP